MGKMESRRLPDKTERDYRRKELVRTTVGRPAVHAGFALQSRRKVFDALAHDFARLELHRSPRGNHKRTPGLVWITPDPRTSETDFEDAEVPEFHSFSLCKCVGDMIQC